MTSPAASQRLFAPTFATDWMRSAGPPCLAKSDGNGVTICHVAPWSCVTNKLVTLSAQADVASSRPAALMTTEGGARGGTVAVVVLTDPLLLDSWVLVAGGVPDPPDTARVTPRASPRARTTTVHRRRLRCRRRASSKRAWASCASCEGVECSTMVTWHHPEPELVGRTGSRSSR